MARRTPPRLANGLLAATWILLVVIAVSVGMLISGALAAGGSARPLSAAEVTQALAEAAGRNRPTPTLTPTLTPTETATVAPPSANPASLLKSTGGTVVASCSGGQASILSATAAQGYTVEDESEKAPASISFESGSTKFRLTLGCSGEIPNLIETSSTETENQK